MAAWKVPSPLPKPDLENLRIKLKNTGIRPMIRSRHGRAIADRSSEVKRQRAVPCGLVDSGIVLGSVFNSGMLSLGLPREAIVTAMNTRKLSTNNL